MNIFEPVESKKYAKSLRRAEGMEILTFLCMRITALIILLVRVLCLGS